VGTLINRDSFICAWNRRLLQRSTYDLARVKQPGDLRAFRDFGVGYVDFNFAGDSADAMVAEMRRFREDVLAKV